MNGNCKVFCGRTGIDKSKLYCSGIWVHFHHTAFCVRSKPAPMVAMIASALLTLAQ